MLGDRSARCVTVSLSRAQLVSRCAKGGTALLLADSVAGSFARSASADAIPDADLAYARLLIGAELLAADFYERAIASRQFIGHSSGYFALTIDEASNALDAYIS